MYSFKSEVLSIQKCFLVLLFDEYDKLTEVKLLKGLRVSAMWAAPEINQL